ncbi:GNAT family N-acetyltransferase [Legionella jamestowniensis]|uniref:Acetyltransferase n=1 Tax=Legionella jamestowniensis TaxID=455 RepID=A0A0W0UIB3_9GAMM|nr:GNAT family N-acetyltransferase [Legionella jamestowniensis]KTD07567.1 GNAT family acetyltransferase [Legionella jamestowniensis]OCH97665.1 acetyltransferase [Legionella jamestowniensis]SFM01844.1 Protein N-acetyltransferase, RimJ/RimL family [Legionella jamestowniensis DSM 19215]
MTYLITTKRLGLRPMRKEDITYLETLDKDPEVKKYYPEGTLSCHEIKEYMKECQCNFENKNLPCLVIFTLKTDKFVGEAYFDELETGEIKVGYLFHKKYWNKGYATEVLKALLEWAKHNIDSDYIIAYADKSNTASLRVMEKCGMQYYKEDVYLDMESRFYRIKNR